MEDNEELTEMFEIIEEQSKQGADIVANMVEFASPAKPKKEICDIGGILEDVLKLQESFFILENINIKKDYSYTNKINVDKGQMKQVFLNLLINARDAIKTVKKGTIIISIKEISGKIEICVRDTGVGMDEETRKNIFNPFYTTKGARAKDRLGIKGTGLGLSVTHSIIQNHNGTIDVESKEGKGSTFIITLPIAVTEEKEKIYKKEELNLKRIKETKGLRILVVDDEKRVADMFKKVFERSGHRKAVTANSGEEALSIFKNESFDLVFLDMLLPDMNGEEIFEEIKKLNPEIPVIFISAKIGLKEEKIKETGAYGFLQKPFDIDQIFGILSEISELRNRD